MNLDIDEIAKKARLNLSEEEKKEFSKDLKEITKAFAVLAEVDTSNVEKSLQPVRNENQELRKDKVKEKQINPFQSEADEHDNYFKGPRLQ